MSYTKEFNEILDIALERVLHGEDLNIVLAEYPRFAAALEPLLRTALETRAAVKISPRAEFRSQAALDFQKAIQQMPVKNAPRASVNAAAPRRGLFGWGMAWSVSLAALLLVLLTGTGVVAASSYALPDNPLYSVKLAAESVEYALTPTQTGKAELLVTFNDRRVDELVKMADKGNIAAVAAINSRVASNMDKISSLTAGQTAASLNNASKSTFGMAAATAPQQSDTSMTSESMPSAATAPRANVPPQTTVAAPTTTTTTTAGIAGVPLPSAVTPTLTVVSPGTETTPALLATPAPTTSLEHGAQGNSVTNGAEDKWAKLRRLMSDAQYKNLQALMDAYNRAPDSLKPIIQQTIDLILQGYDMSLSNLAP